MAANAGYATLRIIPSAQGFQAALQRQIQAPVRAASQQAGQHISQGLARGGQQGAAAVTRAVRQSANDSKTAFDKFGGFLRQTLFKYAAGYLAIGAAVRTVSSAFSFATDSIVGFNSRLEQSQIAFTTFLGSSEAATAYLEDLQEFARSTPFDFDTIRASAQQLIAMGFAAKDVLPTLTAIGDAAAGVGASSEAVRRVVLAFGQIQAKGRVQSDELLQLQEIGIGALKILANQYGLTTLEMQKLISENKVLSEEAIPLLVKGLEEGTATTAAFGGMMAKQARTWQGALSNINDAMQQALATAFRPFFDEISKGAVNLSDTLGSESFKQFADNASESVAKAVAAFKGIAAFVRSGDFSVDLGEAFGLSENSETFRVMARVRDVIVQGMRDIGDAVSSVVNDMQRLAPSLGKIAGLLGAGALAAFSALASLLSDVVAPALSAITSVLKTAADAFNSMPGPIKAVILALGALVVANKVFGVTLGGYASATAAQLGRAKNVAASLGTAWTYAGQAVDRTKSKFGQVGQQVGIMAKSFGSLKSGAAGLVGVLGGPWGLALGGAALALGAFAAKSAESRARQEELKAALDQTTGALNEQSAQLLAKQLADAVDPSQWKNLEKYGITLESVIAAITKGGPELDALRERLSGIAEAGTSAAGSTGGRGGPTVGMNGAAKAAEALGRAVGDTSGALAKATSEVRAAAKAAEAARAGFYGISVEALRVKDALDALPRNVQINASAEGFGAVVKAIQAAYNALRTLDGYANYGSFAAPGSRAGNAARNFNAEFSRLLLEAEAARKKAGEAASKAGAAVGSSISGGSGSKAAKAAAASARGVASSFIEALLDSLKDGRIAVANAARQLLLAVQAEAKKQGGKSAIVTYVARQNAELVRQATIRDTIVAKITAANEKLEALKEKASELAQATAAGINSLFDASQLTRVRDMVKALQVNVQAAEAFQANLLALAKRGLNADTISQLAQAGVVGGGDAARALANASDEEIKRINELQAQLAKTAATTGSQLANELYTAGVRAAQGLIKGLQSQQTAIEKMMLTIAVAMQKAIKAALGIKSPSAVFAGIGEQVAAGLVVGIDGGRSGVDAAVARLVDVPGAPGGRAGAPYGRQTIVNVNGSGRSDAELAERVATIQRREDLLRAPVLAGV